MTGRLPDGSDIHLAAAFATSTAGLAGDLCNACKPLLPVLQGRILRVDELSVTSALERQSPLAAAVMALGPAVAAAGVGVSAIGRMAAGEVATMVGVAESVVEVAMDALDALDGKGDRGDAPVDFAHRLAHATHQASALATGLHTAGVRTGRGHPLRTPVLWPKLLDQLSTRIRVKQHWKDGPGADAWLRRVQAASACRDAAVHSMRAHAAAVAGRAASSTERLIRCLTFASLYCGFAMLDRPPWPSNCAAARADSTATSRVPVPVQLRRLVYPFRPDGQGALAL
ncbi:MAG: hypothetical protein ABSH07_05170 [Candidatus Dormibacteria bacterium]|jgi:hypothetical protein